MNINEKPDTDYNSKDIVNAHQFCKGIYDYEILSTLVEASRIINDNDNILNNLKDVSKMTARNLIKVSKICEDTERNEQMTNLQSNVLKTRLVGLTKHWSYKEPDSQKLRKRSRRRSKNEILMKTWMRIRLNSSLLQPLMEQQQHSNLISMNTGTN